MMIMSWLQYVTCGRSHPPGEKLLLVLNQNTLTEWEANREKHVLTAPVGHQQTRPDQLPF